MFNKPPRRAKLYIVTSGNDVVGIFPTKKLAKQIECSDKKVVEMNWNGGFFTQEVDQSLRTVSPRVEFDF
jgi:hypothetical protein